MGISFGLFGCRRWLELPVDVGASTSPKQPPQHDSIFTWGIKLEIGDLRRCLWNLESFNTWVDVFGALPSGRWVAASSTWSAIQKGRGGEMKF